MKRLPRVRSARWSVWGAALRRETQGPPPTHMLRKDMYFYGVAFCTITTGAARPLRYLIRILTVGDADPRDRFRRRALARLAGRAVGGLTPHVGARILR